MLLLTLVPTILIELGVLLLLRERRQRVLVASVGINVVTNVPLNLVADFVGRSLSVILAGELVVIAVEALFYRLLTGNWRQAVIYSLLCNAISFLLGLLALLIFIIILS